MNFIPQFIRDAINLSDAKKKAIKHDIRGDILITGTYKQIAKTHKVSKEVVELIAKIM